MIYKIKAGKHRAWPPRLGISYKKKEVSALVVFNTDCRYSIDGQDMLDTNKLMGLGYLWNHHIDSARFGWRYDLNSDKIVLVAYCYRNAERTIMDMCKVDILEPVTLFIYIEAGRYAFFVDGKHVANIPFSHKKKWSFPLGLYFGGNRAAPKNMTVEIKKL